MNNDWIIEESALLKREAVALNAIMEPLTHTTDELNALVSLMRDNLAERQVLYSTGDWPAYLALKALNDDRFLELDWLVVNLG